MGLTFAQPGAPPPADRFDFNAYAKAALDGVTGDLDLEAITDVLSARRAIAKALEARFRRPLTAFERAASDVAVMLAYRHNAVAAVTIDGAEQIPLVDQVKLLREAFMCPACGKTTAVMNVSHRGYRPERITIESHCSCEDGPAHHLLVQRHLEQERAS